MPFEGVCMDKYKILKSLLIYANFCNFRRFFTSPSILATPVIHKKALEVFDIFGWEEHPQR